MYLYPYNVILIQSLLTSLLIYSARNGSNITKHRMWHNHTAGWFFSHMIKSENEPKRNIFSMNVWNQSSLIWPYIFHTKICLGGNSTPAPSSGLCHQETYLLTTLKVLLGSVKISKNFSSYINYLFSVHPQLRDGLWQPPVLGTQQSWPAGYTLCVHNSPSRYIFLKINNISKYIFDTECSWIKTA